MSVSKQELAKSLKILASRTGQSGDFWDKIAAAILNGQIQGIDPRVHMRNPLRPEKIAKHIHELIGDGTPYAAVHGKVRAVYLQLVQLVLKDLDY